MKLVYMATAGAEDPTRASIPLHLAANGSVEVGHETAVVLGGDATEIILENNVHRLEGVGVPAVRDLVGKLRDHSVPFYV